jgi:beta-N-acetylhexosaminidase
VPHRLPRDPIKRRRLAALACIALLAAVGGAAWGAGSESGSGSGTASTRTEPAGASPPAEEVERATEEVDRLTPRQRAGQLVVLRFLGTSAPSYVLRALRERRVAGVVLFRDNVVSPAQLRRLTRSLHRAAGGRTLIAIDQEGGAIRNVPWAAPRSAPPSVSTTRAARGAARAVARDLRGLGINVNLAPVADVAAVGGSVMRSRAFPGDARAVARLVDATVRAYAGTGVAATAKHFPGLGASTANTDFAQVVRGVPELRPFAAAVRAGVPLVMVGHAVYPSVDGDRIASQSRPVLTGLLRERLGYRGVIVTDSLEAKASVRRSQPDVSSLRSIAAGGDLMLTTGRGSYLPVLTAIAREARRSAGFRARVRESAARVLALRRTLAPG